MKNVLPTTRLKGKREVATITTFAISHCLTGYLDSAKNVRLTTSFPRSRVKNPLVA